MPRLPAGSWGEIGFQSDTHVSCVQLAGESSPQSSTNLCLPKGTMELWAGPKGVGDDRRAADISRPHWCVSQAASKCGASSLPVRRALLNPRRRPYAAGTSRSRQLRRITSHQWRNKLFQRPFQAGLPDRPVWFCLQRKNLKVWWLNADFFFF